MQLLIDGILFHCHSYSMRLVRLKFFHLDFSFFNHWFIYCLCSEFLKMYAFIYKNPTSRGKRNLLSVFEI